MEKRKVKCGGYGMFTGIYGIVGLGILFGILKLPRPRQRTHRIPKLAFLVKLDAILPQALKILHLRRNRARAHQQNN